MPINKDPTTPPPMIGKIGPYTVFVTPPSTPKPVVDQPVFESPQKVAAPPVQPPPQQFQKPVTVENGSALGFFKNAVTKVQNAHSSLDDHLARWFGLNQSKYQWALDDYYENKGLAGHGNVDFGEIWKGIYLLDLDSNLWQGIQISNPLPGKRKLEKQKKCQTKYRMFNIPVGLGACPDVWGSDYSPLCSSLPTAAAGSALGYESCVPQTIFFCRFQTLNPGSYLLMLDAGISALIIFLLIVIFLKAFEGIHSSSAEAGAGCILRPGDTKSRMVEIDRVLNEIDKPIQFSSHQLRIATDNFSHFLGAGGFGAVYKVCRIEEKDRDTAHRMAMVALWCVQYQPEARPCISVVVKMLEGGLEIPAPKNPFPHLMTQSPVPDLVAKNAMTAELSTLTHNMKFSLLSIFGGSLIPYKFHHLARHQVVLIAAIGPQLPADTYVPGSGSIFYLSSSMATGSSFTCATPIMGKYEIEIATST
ncbi:hypothetical protein Pint_14096 [Pistacia integerrima]|uniref:Uncharacterized protein n=1 Tax=Pistacia integerrima TaxID=434235 RepID=A0ACC0Y8U1_9ROSI|nr:hypothetical protein Pint_14096 [Pistacia integerrima]